MLHVIIDGYNLIRQIPALQTQEKISLESGRRLLLDKLRKYRKYKTHKITVVFDGTSALSESPSTYKEAGINICFSPEHRSADDVIKELARSVKGRGVVVSSDRSITDFASGHGCAVLDSVTFYDKLKLAELTDIRGAPPGADEDKAPRHKRWMTYKKGPGKKLPKAERRNKLKTDKL